MTQTRLARIWPHFLVWTFVLAVCITVWLTVTDVLERERAEFRNDAQRKLLNLTRLTSEHAYRTLKSGETVLRMLQVWATTPEPSRPPLPKLGEWGLIDYKIFAQVGIIDANGVYRYSNLPHTPPLNLSDREHFKVHKAADTGQLFVSRAVIGRATGKASIQLTRRINKPDGGFGGVAVVSIDADYFSRFYDELDLGRTGTASLVGTDTYIRARRTTVPMHFDTSIKGSPLFGLLDQGLESGSFVTRSPVDGVERLLTFRRVPEFRLIVTAGLGTGEMLTDIQQRQSLDQASAAAFIVLLLILAGTFSWLYQREQVQRDRIARANAAVAREHKLLTDLADQVPGELFQYRVFPDGRSCIPYASKHFLDFYQVTAEQLQRDASPALRYQHPDDRARIAETVAECTRNLQPWKLEYRLLMPDGSTIWRSGHAHPERLEDGSTLWHGYITDITERVRMESDIRIAAVAFQSMEPMDITDAQGRIVRVNEAFVELFGYSEQELIGQNPRKLSSGRQTPEFYRAMWAKLLQDGTWAGEIWNRRKDGDVFPEWLTITAVKDSTGLITHYVGTHTDLTLRKQAEVSMQRLAFLDPLTQLPNRRLLIDRLEQACVASARSGRLGALMFIDLDKFKELNDRHGHDFGDLLLQQVAQRLKDCVREGDTVARLGGDEFVLVLADLSENSAEARLQAQLIGDKILTSTRQPYQLMHLTFHNSCSIGVVFINGKRHESADLLREADHAMYQAKHQGPGHIAFADTP